MERGMQWQCMPRCRSQDHGTVMAAAITCGTPHQVKTFVLSHCLNPFHIMDATGRNLLHVAASSGKLEVMEWLLENGADVRVKDKESGWTPLHRSLFYGQISCAIHLIRHGASLKRYDKEDLSPLELIMKDIPAYVSYDGNNPTQAYTWGSNSNFNLGHGRQRSREQPELVDSLVAHNHSIKQVVMCKFHTLFLTHAGRVLSCGHGHGGRLGLGDETTCLRPQVIKSLGNRCKMVAGARDHSLFLMESGNVMSSGDNNYLQLGHSTIGQCPVPKTITSKTLKNREVIGIAAGRFHSVIYTKDAVFTFGLNAGQLGHNKGEKLIPTPRQVTSLCHPNIIIRDVAASDAATVCLTKDGDIYVLHEYQCRKVASNHLSVKHLAVVGGYLDAELAVDVLRKQGGEELQLLALHSNGKVFSWGKSDNSWRQCMWTHRRPLTMLSVAFNPNHMVFITAEGEGYLGQFINKKLQADTSSKLGQQDRGSKGEQNLQMVSLVRLPVIHRATAAACDPQGRNFVVLQSDPRTSLTELPECSASEIESHLTQVLMEADSTDLIHDVLIKIDNHRLAAHKFILATGSEYFAKIFASPDAESNNSHDNGKLPHFPTMSNDDGTCTVDLTGAVDYDVFRLLMQYMYTTTCDVFLPGFVPPTLPPRQNGEANPMTIEREPVSGESYGMEELTINERNRSQSAFSVYRDQETGRKRMKEEKEKEEGGKRWKRGRKKGSKGGQQVDTPKSKNAGPLAAVRLIIDEAKKFGMKSLAKRLENVKCLEGRLVNFGPRVTPLGFDRMSHTHLCDVVLKSEEGALFPAHKCILTARLDYFNSMLGSGWMEASTNEPLKMAIPAAALVVLLDYLYSDQAQKLHASQDLDLLCSTLAIADQFFVTRLKDMCELALADLITLRNVCELLQFASMYQARQLKATCHQFICLNLACLIEAGSLDALEDDVLEELSVAYKATLPYSRFITPSTDCPELGHIDPYPEGEDVTQDDASSSAPLESKSSSTSLSDFEALARKAKAKRKGRRRTSSTGKHGPSSMCESGDDSAHTGGMSLSEETQSPAGAHRSDSCSDLPPSRSASIGDGMSNFPQTTSSESLGNLGSIEDGLVLSFSSGKREKGSKKKKGQAAKGDRFLATADFQQTTSPEGLGDNADEGNALSLSPRNREENKNKYVGDTQMMHDGAGSERQWMESAGGHQSKPMVPLTVVVPQESEKDEPISSSRWGSTSSKSPVMDLRDIMQAQSGTDHRYTAHTRPKVIPAPQVTLPGSYPMTSPGKYPSLSPGEYPLTTLGKHPNPSSGMSSIISPTRPASDSMGHSAIISPTRTASASSSGGRDQPPTVSPTQRPSGGKGPTPLGKKSQKQRKREQQQQAALANAGGGVAGGGKEETGDKGAAGQVPIPAPCPWAKLTSPSPSQVSFRDLQAEDEKTASLRAGTSSSPAEKRTFAAARKISFGLAAPSNQRSVETEKANGPPTSPESPKETINPWQRVGATSPPAPSLSFTDIIRAESEQRENLDRARKKSLAQIQIEERAMEQLMSRYRALDRPDEYITVDRVHCVMATPLWKKKDDR